MSLSWHGSNCLTGPILQAALDNSPHTLVCASGRHYCLACHLVFGHRPPPLQVTVSPCPEAPSQHLLTLPTRPRPSASPSASTTASHGGHADPSIECVPPPPSPSEGDALDGHGRDLGHSASTTSSRTR